jgi:hypothetical protein
MILVLSKLLYLYLVFTCNATWFIFPVRVVRLTIELADKLLLFYIPKPYHAFKTVLLRLEYNLRNSNIQIILQTEIKFTCKLIPPNINS